MFKKETNSVHSNCEVLSRVSTAFVSFNVISFLTMQYIHSNLNTSWIVLIIFAYSMDLFCKFPNFPFGSTCTMRYYLSVMNQNGFYKICSRTIIMMSNRLYGI